MGRRVGSRGSTSRAAARRPLKLDPQVSFDRRCRSAGLAALVVIIWGLCFVLIQASLPSRAPLLLAALRALIGGGILAAGIALRGWRLRTRSRHAGPAVPDPSRSGLPSIPLLVALALTNAGLAVAMVGVVLVATTSSGATRPDGVALALIAAVAPAAGTVVMRRLAPTVDLLATTSAQFLLGGAILLAVSALFEPWGLSWSLAMLPGLLVLGVLGTGFAYVTWFWLLDRISLVRLGTALFLVPVTGIVAAARLRHRPRNQRDRRLDLPRS